MSGKPTGGEWVNNCFLVVAKGPGLVGNYGGQEICHTGGGRCSSEEAEANARLIAEAGTVYNATGLGPRALAERVKLLELACSKQNEEVCQILGKALGYPWLRDDQRNFPGATEDNGVCVGEHCAESIAESAAKRIATLQKDAERWRKIKKSHEQYGEMAVCFDAGMDSYVAVGDLDAAIDSMEATPQ